MAVRQSVIICVVVQCTLVYKIKNVVDENIKKAGYLFVWRLFADV